MMIDSNISSNSPKFYCNIHYQNNPLSVSLILGKTLRGKLLNESIVVLSDECPKFSGLG